MGKQESWLIIGGGGFVGRNLAKMLLDRGETDVTVLDLRPSPLADPRLKAFLTGDITNRQDMVSACHGKTVVVHTASPIEGMPASVYLKVNVDGTKNVVEACLECGVKKLVYTSTASVTYNGQNVINGNEKDPYCEVHMNAYNETKAIAEDHILKSNGKKGLLTIALRPSGIFGPADTQGCYNLVEAAKNGNWKFMIGSNDTLFDWTYVDNVSHAHILAAQKLAEGNGTAGEVRKDPSEIAMTALVIPCEAVVSSESKQAFYITNGEPIFFWDFPRALYDGLGLKRTLRIRIPKSVGFALGRVTETFKMLLKPIKELNPTFTHFRVKIITNNRYLDISKARERLGYEPIVPLEEGMRRTVEYWKTVYDASR
ncbi:hypothetical protein HK104_005040 [Borealophlyctis nickersoniae]|nr:hypothetical protein HK104_005040 [Borealophlyctis nickersoniae]